MRVMRAFLKCFYGYRNLGDELLFRGVVEYIHPHYPEVTDLTVEVADVAWMEHRYDTNRYFVSSLLGYTYRDKPLHSLEDEDQSQKPFHFRDGGKKLQFVEISKDIRDNFRYDRYFFGGGEVFAESRGRHGGRNYRLRYLFVRYTKPFVLLGGIETPTSLRQKVLYKHLLPKADHIICREQQSYQTSMMYLPESRVTLYQDFAVGLIHHYLQHKKKPYHIRGITDTHHPRYIIINMMSACADESSFDLIRNCIERYQDCVLIYVHGSESDRMYGEWLIGAYPQTQLYDWTEHSLEDTLTLFAHAQAGIACRLHILLLLQELGIDRYALVYAEKVSKLITSTLSFNKN